MATKLAPLVAAEWDSGFESPGRATRPFEIVAVEVNGQCVWPAPNLEEVVGELVDVLGQRFEQMQSSLDTLVGREVPKEWYTIEEFAKLVDRESFTVREWCRLGRIHATKQKSGRGKYRAWVITHAELTRYQKEGLLPDRRRPTR